MPLPPPPPPMKILPKTNWRKAQMKKNEEIKILEPALLSLANSRQALDQVRRAQVKYDFPTMMHYSKEVGKGIKKLLKSLKKLNISKRKIIKDDIDSLKKQLVSTCNTNLLYRNTEVSNLEVRGKMMCEEYLLMLNSVKY